MSNPERTTPRGLREQIEQLPRYDIDFHGHEYRTTPSVEQATRGKYLRRRDVLALLDAEAARPQDENKEETDTRLAKTAVNRESGSTAASNEDVPSIAPEKRPHWEPHDDQCESELTSHGYTPCQCRERQRADDEYFRSGTRYPGQ